MPEDVGAGGGKQMEAKMVAIGATGWKGMRTSFVLCPNWFSPRLFPYRLHTNFDLPFFPSRDPNSKDVFAIGEIRQSGRINSIVFFSVDSKASAVSKGSQGSQGKKKSKATPKIKGEESVEAYNDFPKLRYSPRRRQ